VADLTLSSGFYKITSCVCFAWINLILKTIGLPASQVTCLESLLGAMLLWSIPLFFPTPAHAPMPHPVVSTPYSKKVLYWIRAMLALLSSWLWVVSVQKLPLLQTVAMGFLSPFVTLLGAWFFLHEKLTFWRILAIFLAFIAGTLISVGGQMDQVYATLFDPWILAPLGTTVLFSITNLISKSLLTITNPLQLTRSLMLATGIGLLTTCGHWVWPSLLQTEKLCCLGILASLAHSSAHLAMSKSDIVALLPLGVVRVILTGVLGWFFLHETPSFWLVCGIIFGIGASLCLSWSFKK